MDWFLYDNGLRLERVNFDRFVQSQQIMINFKILNVMFSSLFISYLRITLSKLW